MDKLSARQDWALSATTWQKMSPGPEAMSRNSHLGMSGRLLPWRANLLLLPNLLVSAWYSPIA